MPPEAKNDFVQGRLKELMGPGVYQIDLIKSETRAEEDGEPYASKLHYSSPEWTRNSVCAPEHMETNCSYFGRSTAP